ncbi:MAG: allophanate hydrolase subunit 1 [Pseudomonadota bacterium]
MTKFNLSIITDDIVEVSVPDIKTAQHVAQGLRAFGDCIEVVPTRTTVAVMFSPSRISLKTLRLRIDEVFSTPPTAPSTPAGIVILPVQYGGEEGPDLELIADQLETTPQKIVEVHSSQLFVVDLMGFTPGFAYLSELEWSVSRLDTPRPFVEAGSIGLAGRLSGIYSLQGPGGWPIIGRTTHQLFDLNADPPFLLKPGCAVRFQPVGS